ncbi:MAG TPA: hypothetical protein VHZ64_09035 [Xanthobacteraceae bacterium]|jgi:hypothetical protein|nr:hypothetical protein [Xanthobacteraceae bacterium]
MSDARANRIDDAVAKAGELIGVLMTKGPVGPGQARLIVEAVVRAAVPNFTGFELRDSARRIASELEGVGANGNRAPK